MSPRTGFQRLIPDDENDGIPLNRREMYSLIKDAHGGDLIRAKMAALAWWGKYLKVPTASQIVRTVKGFDEEIVNVYRSQTEPPRPGRGISRTSTAADARLWLINVLGVAFDDLASEDGAEEDEIPPL